MDEIKPIEIKKVKKHEPLESTISTKIIRYLNAIPGCKAVKRHQGGANNRGDADIFGCINGRHFEFEVKRRNKKLTLLQLTKQKEWEIVGSIVGRVESIDDIKLIFRMHKIYI